MNSFSEVWAAGLRSKGFLLLVLLTACLEAYLNSFSVPFVFDDISSIVENASIRHLSSFQWLHPAGSSPVGGRPLTNFTFALNYSFGGLDPFNYHFLNFFIHFSSGCIIFLGLMRIFGRRDMPSAVSRDSIYLAFICALIWLCHPLTTYTITYVSQRSEELEAFFYLVVLYSSWLWFESPKLNWKYSLVAIGACFCGMACKEGMATAPVMVWLLDRTFFSKEFRTALKTHGRFYFGLGLSWLLLAYLYGTAASRGVGFGEGLSSWSYALTEARVIFLYLKLIAMPFPLVLDYSDSVIASHGSQFWYAGALLTLLGLVVILLWRRPTVGFASAWFFVLLAPTSSFVPIPSQPMGENREYLAMLGPIVLIVIVVFNLFRRLSWPIFGIAACFCVQLTLSRNQDYQSAVNIWLDTIKKVPASARAESMLGSALLREGRLDEADRAFDRAILLKPGLTASYTDKGGIALAKGDLSRAEYWYKLSIRSNPDQYEVWRNLGGVLFDAGKLAEANLAFHQALKLRPDDGLALTGVGSVFQSRGQLSEAIKSFRTSIYVDPDVAATHNNLGSALLATGQANEAFVEFATAVRLKPTLSRPHANLATMYASNGYYREAVAQYLEALRLAPEDNGSRTNLGLAYQFLRNFRSAKVCYIEVLRRNPKDVRASSLLAKLSAEAAVGGYQN